MAIFSGGHNLLQFVARQTQTPPPVMRVIIPLTKGLTRRSSKNSTPAKLVRPSLASLSTIQPRGVQWVTLGISLDSCFVLPCSCLSCCGRCKLKHVLRLVPLYIRLDLPRLPFCLIASLWVRLSMSKSFVELFAWFGFVIVRVCSDVLRLGHHDAHSQSQGLFVTGSRHACIVLFLQRSDFCRWLS